MIDFVLRGSPAQFPTPDVVDIPVDLSQTYGRGSAERFAQSISIPSHLKELILTVGVVSNLSALVEFISQILIRLPAQTKLVISLPRSHYIADLGKWLNDARVSVRSR